jgi:hypothetical protein
MRSGLQEMPARNHDDLQHFLYAQGRALSDHLFPTFFTAFLGCRRVLSIVVGLQSPAALTCLHYPQMLTFCITRSWR